MSFGLAEEHKSKPFDRGKGTAVVTTPPNPNQVIAVYVRATYRLHKLNSEVQVAGFHSIHARQKRHDEERPFIVITKEARLSACLAHRQEPSQTNVLKTLIRSSIAHLPIALPGFLIVDGSRETGMTLPR